jgi:hypothetical protein
MSKDHKCNEYHESNSSNFGITWDYSSGMMRDGELSHHRCGKMAPTLSGDAITNPGIADVKTRLLEGCFHMPCLSRDIEYTVG